MVLFRRLSVDPEVNHETSAWLQLKHGTFRAHSIRVVHYTVIINGIPVRNILYVVNIHGLNKVNCDNRVCRWVWRWYLLNDFEIDESNVWATEYFSVSVAYNNLPSEKLGRIPKTNWSKSFVNIVCCVCRRICVNNNILLFAQEYEFDLGSRICGGGGESAF